MNPCPSCKHRRPSSSSMPDEESRGAARVVKYGAMNGGPRAVRRARQPQRPRLPAGGARRARGETDTDDVECIVVDSALEPTAAGRTSSGTGRGHGAALRGQHRLLRRLQPRRRGGARPAVAFVNFDGEVEPGWDAPLRAAARRPGRRRSPPGCSLRRTARRSRRPGSRSRRTRRRTGCSRARRAAPRPTSRSRSPLRLGALMMVRRDEFLALGGFYEPIFMYGEEADYALRVAGPGRAAPGERDPSRTTAPPPGPPRSRDAALLRLAQPARQRGAAPAAGAFGARRRGLRGLRRCSRSRRCAAGAAARDPARLAGRAARGCAASAARARPAERRRRPAGCRRFGRRRGAAAASLGTRVSPASVAHLPGVRPQAARRARDPRRATGSTAPGGSRSTSARRLRERADAAARADERSARSTRRLQRLRPARQPAPARGGDAAVPLALLARAPASAARRAAAPPGGPAARRRSAGAATSA